MPGRDRVAAGGFGEIALTLIQRADGPQGPRATQAVRVVVGAYAAAKSTASAADSKSITHSQAVAPEESLV